MQEHFLGRDPQQRKECMQKTLQSIVGFDGNPLAVIVAQLVRRKRHSILFLSYSSRRFFITLKWYWSRRHWVRLSL